MLKNVFDPFYKVDYTLHVGGPHARGMPRAQDDGKNGSYALEFTHLPPHTYDCHAMHILYLFSTLKALRGFGDAAASVQGRLFLLLFSSLKKK